MPRPQDDDIRSLFGSSPSPEDRIRAILKSQPKAAPAIQRGPYVPSHSPGPFLERGPYTPKPASPGEAPRIKLL